MAFENLSCHLFSALVCFPIWISGSGPENYHIICVLTVNRKVCFSRKLELVLFRASSPGATYDTSHPPVVLYEQISYILSNVI